MSMLSKSNAGHQQIQLAFKPMPQNAVMKYAQFDPTDSP
jgi:hypothetical protein